MTRKHSDIYCFQSDISYRNNYREYGKEVQFTGGSMVKTSLPMQERWVQFLGREDPLEKEMATHFSILAWRIPWTGWLQSMGLQRVGYG